MSSELERAIAIGEISWAVRIAKAEARKAKGRAKLAALRTVAELELGHADDTDLPWVTRAANAWRAVTGEAGADARDREMLAWSELLANRPRKAKEASAEDVEVLSKAIAFATKRSDDRRAEALVRAALAATPERMTLAARVLAQSEQCPAALVTFLPEVHETPKTGEEMRARVSRVEAEFGAASAALEMPLVGLAHNAKETGDVATEIDARQRLEPILAAKGSAQENLIDRHLNLGDLRRALTTAKRFDEAFAALEREESVKAKRKLHLVPDHHARADVYEALGDWDRVTELLVLHVAQFEAGPPPVYGKGSANAEHARLHARLRLERGGRGKEAKRLFGK